MPCTCMKGRHAVFATEDGHAGLHDTLGWVWFRLPNPDDPTAPKKVPTMNRHCTEAEKVMLNDSRDKGHIVCRSQRFGPKGMRCVLASAT